tara:strand:- start:1286 stop:1732 length:447 start_codon:yes stop_codon:yes gene_type:complete
MPAPLDLSQSFTGRKMVYLTKLEKEIIEHRLGAPDAMAECLAHDERFGLSYDEAEAIYDERLPGLVEKLLANAALDKYEVEAVRDIASCEVYAHMAEDAIGFEWEDGKQMTPHWASRIWNTYDDLSYKLLKSINACPVTGEDEKYGNV